MKLGILLSLGSSFKDLKNAGQEKRFIDYYLKKYNKYFQKTYIFSYQNEKYSLPKECQLINNKFSINRFIYSLLLPFLNYKTIRKIGIFRVMQLTGVLPAVLIKIFFHKPFIFTYGYDYPSFAKLEGQKIRLIFLKILKQLAMKFCSGVIVTNKLIEKQFKKKYPKTRIIYLPNGVDISKFKMKNEEFRIKIQNSKLIKLLFVGRLERQKNLLNLIEAVSLLNKKYSVNLLLIGQGKLKNQLIKLAKRLDVNLQILNSIPYDKIIKYYQQANVFVLPSFLEGHPKALLEAMSCGLPCVVSKYFGIGEFKNNKEILMTGFKAKEIAANLIRLVKNRSLRERLKNNARKRVEKDFDINKLINKEIKILKNV